MEDMLSFDVEANKEAKDDRIIDRAEDISIY